MFLSRITLSRKNFRDWKITDEYSLHRLVYSLFGTEARDRFLYVDKGVEAGFHTLLVLSKLPPQEYPDISVDTREVAESFLEHHAYAFEILLNPVRRIHQTRKREPILGQLPLLQWFLEQAEKHGFSPDAARLMVKVRSAQQFQSKESNQTRHRVLFTGVLKVTDRELFIQAFENGIGGGKAFGFGLLQLIPLQN